MARKEERQNMTKSEVRDMVEPYKPLYTAKQAAQILLINVSTVYELMNTGQLPYLILGKGNGTRKIRGSDLERFIETQKPAEPQGETA
ncbi:helix-turn-helix domain-containing protein [Blautia intestinalis]